MMKNDVNLIEQEIENLQRAIGEIRHRVPAIREAGMTRARQVGANGLLVGSAVLHVLAEEDVADDITIWRRLAERLDIDAWFRAAGPDARRLYDEAMGRLREQGHPKIKDVIKEIACLPAPAAVAGLIDFTIGFLDDARTTSMLSQWLDLVADAAAEQARELKREGSVW